MSTSSAAIGETINFVALGPTPDVDVAMTLADVADVLGISEAGANAIARAGMLGPAIGVDLIGRNAVDALSARIWRVTLPTGSSALGVHLSEVVEACGSENSLWPLVIAALLEGRINAFRRRGVYSERILSSLVVSSDNVISGLTQASRLSDEPPFMWTPTPPA
jgi:hypothetical protein